jgi:putative ABC transport system permease protein
MISELRVAARQLTKAPGFVVVAVLIIAIGVGAATAMFSTVNALVLRPVAIPDPDRVVAIYETNLSLNQPKFPASVVNFADWKTLSTSWASLGALGGRAMNLTGGAEPELKHVLTITSDLLPTVGIPLLAGRGFTNDEDRPGQNQVALITSAYWNLRYGGKADAIGKSLVLDGKAHTIIGVVAESPVFRNWNEIIIPMATDLKEESRSHHDLWVVGRLKPGITFEQADAEMKGVADQILQQHPEAERGWSTRLVPIADDLVGADVRKGLYVLLGAVGLLLLIGCANLSNLLLVRASARAHELAIRTALGASRWQILRQLLAESLLVSVFGGFVGIVLSLWVVDLLRGMPLPRATEISMDLRVLAVACIATILTGVIAGAGPALTASRSRPQEALKGRAPRSGHRSRFRDSMVVAQLALSLTLLVGAALLVRSFWRLLQVDPGYTTENVLTVALRPQTGDAVAFYNQVAERVSALPDVASAAFISLAPLGGANTSLNVFAVGPAAIPNDKSISSAWRLIHGDYFGTMQIPVLKGTGFENLPASQARNSIVISASLARILWGDTDPLGRQVNLGSGNRPVTIIGVVADVRSNRLNLEPGPAYYLSIHRFIYGPLSLVVRSHGDPTPLVARLRDMIKQIDPTVPLFRIRTISELRAESVEQERLVLALLATFAGIALLLATLGTYGVVAFTVQQRTSEIGVRLAIGAQAGDIFRLVLGHGVRLVIWGAVFGLIGAWAGSQVLRALLFETRTTDFGSYVIATLALGGAALLAALLPARRATKVDPLIALRAE